MPKIITCGRTWLHRCEATLKVEGLPECLKPPYTLLEVCAQGECSWVQSGPCLRVTVPLLCRVKDGCGCCHVGRACIEVEVRLCPSPGSCDCWRSQVLLQPCVRLICAPCARTEPCFDAQLEALVEAWLVRLVRCTTEPGCAK